MTTRRWVVVAASLAAVAVVIALAMRGSDDTRKTVAGPTSSSGPTIRTPSSHSPLHAPIGKSGYNFATNNIVNPTSRTGGTLHLLAGTDCDSWDPGRTSVGWCWNLQRLITRTLVGYPKVNGIDFKLGPDLATSLGRHNADYTQWTYTLRSGLKYQNGKPITPRDIKYGIERLFSAAVIKSNPYTVDTIAPYFTDSIAHPKSYRGPDKSGDLRTITTTSNSITFTLSSPNADFDYLMALPPSAPVPYGKQPIASGPFEIGSYRPNKSIVFVRNPHWRQSTDDIRHPLVHSIRLRVDRNLDDIDRRLRAGRADARADGGVQPSFRDRILNDAHLENSADDPVLAGSTHYLAISPAAIPNIHCRRAVFYAVDKAAAVRVFGGRAAAVQAASMTPPGIAGFDPEYDPYPSGPDVTGKPAKAEQELRACGKPNGFATRFEYGTPSEIGPNLFRAEQLALGRVGIRITVAPDSPSTYYCANDSPRMLRIEGIGLLSATLSAAYPTGYGLYRPDHTRVPCLEDGDTDLTRLHNQTVNRVLAAAPRGDATGADWQALDRAVMASATYLPLVWDKALYYRNPRMTNVTCDLALASGIYDFVNVGVR